MARKIEEPVEVCSRHLKRFVAETISDVHARVLEPEQVKQGAFLGEYLCRFEVDGLPEPVRGDAHGVDSMQAMLLGLQGVYAALRPFQAELTWVGDSADGEIGFPVTTYGFDFEMHRRLEAALERETNTVVDERAERRKNRNQM